MIPTSGETTKADALSGDVGKEPMPSSLGIVSEVREYHAKAERKQIKHWRKDSANYFQLLTVWSHLLSKIFLLSNSYKVPEKKRLCADMWTCTRCTYIEFLRLSWGWGVYPWEDFSIAVKLQSSFVWSWFKELGKRRLLFKHTKKGAVWKICRKGFITKNIMLSYENPADS